MTLRFAGLSPDAVDERLAGIPRPPVVVGLREGRADGPGRAAQLLGRALDADLPALAALDPAFTGALGQLTVVTAGSRRVAIAGLGTDPSGADLFAAALAASRVVPDAAVSLLALDASTPHDAGLVAQGHAAGAWAFGEDPDLELALVSSHELDAERVALIARVSGWIRTQIETPPNRLGPRAFADAVRTLCADVAGNAVQVSVWSGDDLVERGFGATLAVGASGSEPPLVIELTTAGDGPVTGLAGKGITFDAGGIDLKRDASELAWMKSDLAAAACVAGAVVVAAVLGTGPLRAVLPVAENMPGSRAQRPGDVVTHPDGRTTEVIDTDCEGRLVLADALAWLGRQKVARMVDVGTLTDSGSLGTAFWGTWSTADDLAAELIAAGLASADTGWRLPLHPGYVSLLTSRVADIANAPLDESDQGRHAATYLRFFAGETPWAHIDNGSSAYLERDAWPWAEGPTDAPFRALVQWLSPST